MTPGRSASLLMTEFQVNYAVSCENLIIESWAPELHFWSLLHTILEICYSIIGSKSSGPTSNVGSLAHRCSALCYTVRIGQPWWRYDPIARPTCVTLGQEAFH